jgi:hypothetical protein
MEQEPWKFQETIPGTTEGILCNCYIERLPKNTRRYLDRGKQERDRKDTFDEM